MCLEPGLRRKRSHCDGKPRHRNRVAATRKTQQGRPSATINKYVSNRHAKSLQSCLTLCNPMDCSPPGPSVYEILQARILENFWVAMPFSRGFSQPRDQTCISYLLLRQAGSLPLAPPGKLHYTHTHTHTHTHIYTKNSCCKKSTLGNTVRLLPGKKYPAYSASPLQAGSCVSSLMLHLSSFPA